MSAPTPTPRTDAEMVQHYGDGLGQWVTRDFARTIERELIAMQAERDALREKKATATHWHNEYQKLDARLKKILRPVSPSMAEYRNNLLNMVGRAYAGRAADSQSDAARLSDDSVVNRAKQLIAAVDAAIEEDAAG